MLHARTAANQSCDADKLTLATTRYASNRRHTGPDKQTQEHKSTTDTLGQPKPVCPLLHPKSPLCCAAPCQLHTRAN